MFEDDGKRSHALDVVLALLLGEKNGEGSGEGGGLGVAPGGRLADSYKRCRNYGVLRVEVDFGALNKQASQRTPQNFDHIRPFSKSIPPK